MKKVLYLLAALLVAAACQTSKTCAPQKPIAGHVALIGLDGWGSWCMEKGNYPFIKSAMEEGCYTLYKRTVRPSVSGPNWAAQLNSTPVEVSGIIGNEKEPSFKPLTLTENNAQPTLFYLLRKARPEAETGVVCEWGDVRNYVDLKSVSYEKAIGHPSENPESIVEESVKYIKDKKPVFLFVHIDALDHMGHAYGQGSPEYYEELPKVDDRVRRIVEAYKEAGIYDDTVFILTSDHGHEGTGHGGDTLNEIETPFVIWGKGVRKGEVIKEEVLQYDVAATMAKVFALDTPRSWRGIPVDVFEK